MRMAACSATPSRAPHLMLTDSSWTRHDRIGFALYVRWRLDNEEPMFSKLPESLPAPHRRRLAIAASALVHGAMLWGAAHLTAVARPAPPKPEKVEIYLPVHHPDLTPRSLVSPHTDTPHAPRFPVARHRPRPGTPSGAASDHRNPRSVARPPQERGIGRACRTWHSRQCVAGNTRPPIHDRR